MGPGTEEGLALCSAQTGSRSICHPLARYWMIFCQGLPSFSDKAEEVDPEERPARRIRGGEKLKTLSVSLFSRVSAARKPR